MGKGLFAVIAIAAMLAPAALATRSALHPRVSATLTGRTEVPKGSPVGSGTAVVTLSTKTGKACWRLSVKGIGTPLSAHVHKAPPGKAGPVVIPLGARFSPTGCVKLPMKSILAVERNPAAFYVNVHTKKYLDGAIRGQLHAS
jgi:hypothetical protein